MLNQIKQLIAYASKLRLTHLKKAIAAGSAAAGLALGKDLITSSHVNPRDLVLLALGTGVITFFAPSNAPVAQD